MIPKPKKKKCRICRLPFLPKSSTSILCGFSCAVEYAEQQRRKKDAKQAQQAKKTHREAIKKLRPRGYYVQAAQVAFNAFIRLRDDKLPCICCGKWRNGWDAGHYLARSIRPELRFNEDNVHKQAKFCNNYNKGRAAAGYRDGLIARIGLERVLALEAPHPPAKFTIEELKAIKHTYKQKLKELKNAE